MIDVPFEVAKPDEKPRDAALLELDSLFLELVPDNDKRIETVKSVCAKRGVRSLDDLKKAQVDELLEKLRAKVKEAKN